MRDTGPTQVVGGRRREVRVALDTERLAGRNLSIAEIERALRGANVSVPAGAFSRLDQAVQVDAGSVLGRAEDVAALVVGVAEGLPVYLRDVADVSVGGGESISYVHFGHGVGRTLIGPSGHEDELAAPDAPHDAPMRAAVTVTVAKRKGANAVSVARNVQAQLERLAPMLLPAGVDYQVTRDYGHTANDKVNELVEALAVAIVIVIGLIALTLGWREGLIVAVSVPITFGLTLMVNYLAGYTINRVTLFALILSLGLVVDDPIVDVENIYRHFKMRLRKPLDAVLAAIQEVRPPIILATLAVIISFVPMFFITGMMGPYMRPMALNVPLAMLMSMVVAFTITPWMSYHVLKREYDKAGRDEPYDLTRTGIYRVYAASVRPFLNSRGWAWGLLGIVALLFVLACLLPVTRRVPLKMLPFDNKNEFQVVIDMPEGTTLERTAATAHDLAAYLRGVHEVTDVTAYVGTSSPMDFNAMVRHYYLRAEPHHADLRVNLIDKSHRAYQSHELVLRLRNALAAIAERHGANIKLVQPPPGPPVIATVTVEVYGPEEADYADIQVVAQAVADRFDREPAVVDLDTSLEAAQQKYVFVTDDEKAALAGLTDARIAAEIAAVLGGMDAAYLHEPDRVNPTPIHLRLPEPTRSSIARLEDLYLTGDGGMIQLRELGHFAPAARDQTIYHKNLRPVAYVFADTAGRAPAEAILDMQRDLKPGAPGSPVPAEYNVVWTGEGEWQITVDVFRDLGLAFAAACLGIYILLVYETSSYFMPLVLMISIPLTVIGIMPGFWIMNLLLDQPIDGFANPVFFTATAMIGMIALSGIAVRNAILLIDFIHAAQRTGKPLKQAIIESGAVRFRAIFLTAGTAMLAAAPITLDPIFSGLAWALIFGLFVSTAFTLLVIPVVYHLVYAHRPSPATTAS